MADQPNFAECVAQHVPYLNRMVRGIMRGDPTSEDIVQQTIFKALVHANQFRFDSSLKTWLVSIAINEVNQLYRSKWRTRAVPLTTEIPEVHRWGHVADLQNDCYEAKQRDILVRRAVSYLPGQYRSVVELCDLQSLPMKEAAHKLGLTLPAVKSRRQRARKILRLRLQCRSAAL